MGATVQAGDELAGTVEIDGAYVGKGPKPANKKADRTDRRSVDTKRQVVVVARERGGNARTWIVDSEADAVPVIRKHVASGTTVHADESAAWDILHASFAMKRVNHSVEYMAEDGACTNQAESYFSRLRRAEMGIHHHISGRHLGAYSNEMAWRENNRRRSNGDHWNLITAAALAHPEVGDVGWLLAPEGSMTDHIVSRLTTKRAELARLITELERELDQYRADLTHIDGALRVLSADLDPETIPARRRYARRQYFGRNELSRLCLDTLRLAAGEPLTAEEITIRIMNAKGLEAGDARLRATIRVQAGAVLKRLRVCTQNGFASQELF